LFFFCFFFFFFFFLAVTYWLVADHGPSISLKTKQPHK